MRACSRVWVDDVVDALLRCLHGGANSRQTYELGGPQIYTLREIVRLVAKLTGRRRWIVGLPDFVGRMQAFFMNFVPGRPFSGDNYQIAHRRQRVQRGWLREARHQAEIHGRIRAALLGRARGQCTLEPGPRRRGPRQVLALTASDLRRRGNRSGGGCRKRLRGRQNPFAKVRHLG